MNFIDMMKMRRSVYGLNKQLPVFDDKVFELVKDTMRYIPDAFNMKSQRVIVVTGKKHNDFWNGVYDALVALTGENFSRERIDSFMAGYGTILYFYDMDVVNEYKKKFAKYAEHFDNWAMQSNAMLQFAVWVGLASINIGANLQHYNPVIDTMVRNMFNVPKNWVLNAQMPFGGIATSPENKPHDDISSRVIVIDG